MKKLFLTILITFFLSLSFPVVSEELNNEFNVITQTMEQTIDDKTTCEIVWYKDWDTAIVRVFKHTKLGYDDFVFEQIYAQCLYNWLKEKKIYYKYRPQKRIIFFNKLVNDVNCIVYETTIILKR